MIEMEFDAPVYRWQARTDSAWFFAEVPEELSSDIAEIAAPFARGFGAVRVQASIGTTSWRTSIFPGSGGIYSLPLKRAVRESEGLREGDVVVVRLQVLDG